MGRRSDGSRARHDGVADAVGGDPWPKCAAGLMPAERDTMASRMRAPASALFAISYEPIAGCFFNGDDPLQLMRQVPELLAIRIEPREAFPPLPGLAPYACNLSLQAISARDRDE